MPKDGLVQGGTGEEGEGAEGKGANHGTTCGTKRVVRGTWTGDGSQDDKDAEGYGEDGWIA